MPTPEVSVIVACLGRTLRTHPGRWRATWRTLHAQAGPTLEVVVAVDGEEPKDRDRVREGAGGDARVHIAEPDGTGTVRGPGPTRTRALRESRGAWITSVDAGDRWRRGRLQRLKARIEATHHPAAVDRVVRVLQDGTKLHGPRRNGRHPVAAVFGTYVPVQPLVERTLAGDGWPDVPYCEDLLYAARVASHAGGMEHVPEIGVESVQHRDGQSVHYEGERRPDAAPVFRAMLEALDRHGYGIGSWSDRETIRRELWACHARALEGKM